MLQRLAYTKLSSVISKRVNAAWKWVLLPMDMITDYYYLIVIHFPSNYA